MSLSSTNVSTFQREAFNSSTPAVLPQAFSDLPAIGKWFSKVPGGRVGVELRDEYLLRHGETAVPLEFTNTIQNTFEQFRAPLRLFIEWTRQANFEKTDRLYLAQASASDLPQQLRDDLPVPELVSLAGKGDIYDTNLWIGLAPTYTPLHRDPNPNLFVQIAGTKIVRLFSPSEGAEVFRCVQCHLGRSGSCVFRGEEMMKGEEKRVLEAEVWAERQGAPLIRSTGYEAILKQSDGLFIPKGWWHSIKGIGNDITGSVNWFFR